MLGRLYADWQQGKTKHHWLGLILLVAVTLRVASALYLGDYVVDMPGTFDQVSYDMLAKQVLNGHGFTVATLWWPATRAGEPTAHWSYLYTLYLVAVYGLFGYHPLLARLTQAVLTGALMPWLAYRVGRRHFGPHVGLVAAGLTAIYAYFVYYAGALMTETFYMVAILWTLDLAGSLGQASGQAPKLRSEWLGLGVGLAVAVLLRQVFLFFIPFLFAWLLWRSYRYQTDTLKHTLGGMVLAATILVLSILPWTMRNYRAFGSFVLLNTNAGFAFFWGNHPIHGYNFIDILPADGPSYQDLIPAELLKLNEAELDRALLKQGLGFIRADPGRYLVLSISRIKDYFKFWPSSESGTISNLSRVLSFGILWPFMAFGLIYGLRRCWSSEALILYIFIFAYTGIHLLSWALIRYRLPVDAVLLVFAGITLTKVMERLIPRPVNLPAGYTPGSLHPQDRSLSSDLSPGEHF